MKKTAKYIIGNWKANKTANEVEEWFDAFAKIYHKNRNDKLNNLEIVVCPPFIYLPKANQLCKKYNLPIKLGAQNVSPFKEGPFTGEITAGQLAQYVSYVIIGHSERRTNFTEDDKILTQKVTLALEFGLQPVFCVQNESTFIPTGVTLVAYEPVWAIGSGKADTADNANNVAAHIKKRNKLDIVIYGGSVTALNIVAFLKASQIDGVLPGGASLEATSFWQMILNATSI